MTTLIEQLKEETERRNKSEPGSPMWIEQSERIEQLLDKYLEEMKDNQ